MGRDNELVDFLRQRQVPNKLCSALASHRTIKVFVNSFNSKDLLEKWLKVQCEEKQILGKDGAALWECSPAAGALRVALSEARLLIQPSAPRRPRWRLPAAEEQPMGAVEAAERKKPGPKPKQQRSAPIKRPAAALAAAAPSAAEVKRRKLGMLLSHFQAPASLASFQKEAAHVGFNAKDYQLNGVTVLEKPLFSSEEVKTALAAALRVRNASTQSDNGGEFVFLRGESTPDKKILFSLISRFVPFLNQLLGGHGLWLPGENNAPYAHHNQVQVALKKPGFEGYDKLDRMSNSCVGHIDQSNSRQQPGRNTTNYSVLLGVVLGGATAKRSDAGNLYVAPTSHTQLAEKFREAAPEGHVAWYPSVAEQYFGKSKAPKMKAMRVKPGQAILMHHQTVHGVGPNHTDTDRVNVYFRITAKRPDGKLTFYPEAMRNPFLETPLLQQLAQQKK